MARVWKRQVDKKRKGAAWQFTYFDHEVGRERSRKGFTDKELTEKLARETEEASKARMLGVVDASAESAMRAAVAPIKQHVDAFVSTLEAKGRSPKRVSEVRARIERFIGHADIQRLTDITLDAAAAFVGDIRRDGAGAATIAEYVGAMKQFTRWTAESQRLLGDPLRSLGRPSRSAERKRFRRRALSTEEVGRLLDAARRRPLVEAQTIRRGKRAGKQAARLSNRTKTTAIATGKQRELAYLVAIWTGLRRSELGALRWGDVELDVLPPRIILRSETTKSRRSDVLALHPQMASILRDVRPASAGDADLVLRYIPSMRVLKADLKLAGIPFETEQGRVDFHSMRMSLATMLAANGVPQRTAQAHLRHSDPRLTAMVYTDERVLPIADHISAVPDLPLGPRREADDDRARATGTTGHVISPPDGEDGSPPVTRAAHAQRRAGSDGHSVAQTDHDGGGEITPENERKERASQHLALTGPVGVTGFEPATFSSRTRRATKLRYTPRCLS